MVFQAHEGVDVEKTVTDTQFKIATNSKLFSILSDSIYTRKIDAVIRELCCNAFDAHVEARQSSPFQVTLPDAFMPEFRVRDFGLGLNEVDMQMYTTYGESTKSGSNAYIGAFGIGAKSPFAYTNTFNVTSYHGGMARSYSMFVEQGVPRMTLLGEVSSKEPSGLEVFFAVAEKDIEEFREKAIRICTLMADKIDFLNVPDVWREEFRLEIAKNNWKPAPYIGDGYMTNNLEIDIHCKQDVLNIVQGNVAYEMHMHEVTDMLKFSLGFDYNKIISKAENHFYIAGTLKVPNGTFVPHPSRERLTFDELTKETIKIIFQKIYKYFITDAVDRVLTDVRSYYELHTRLKNYSKLVTSNPRIADCAISDVPDYMIDVRLASILRYDDWRKNDFDCIHIEGGKDRGYRFKSLRMNMYGDQVDKIYYTPKYPLSEEYRYRVLHDKQQTEIKNAIILTGFVGRMFTPKDVASFTSIQSLPKLTPQELTQFKNKNLQNISGGARVTKNEVSYFSISAFKEGHLSQKTSAEIMSINQNHPVYWIGSNHRYKIQLANDVYNLKTECALRRFERETRFILDNRRKKNNIPNKENITIGIVVLPENHELRSELWNLIDILSNEIQEVVSDFLEQTFYEISKSDSDLIFTTLTNNYPDLLLKLVKGTDAEDFFSAWFAAEKPPTVSQVKRWTLPFDILADGDSLRVAYHSNRNIKSISMRSVYENLYENGYPLLENWCWRGGCSDKKIVDDLILYLQEKNKLFAQNPKDGN